LSASCARRIGPVSWSALYWASSFGRGIIIVIMVFKYGRGPEVVPPVRLNGTELKNVNSFRYLGHILTDKLKDDDDQQYS
jgi:hypothetical protein